MKTEELGKLADEYASSYNEEATAYKIGLMRGFIAGYRKGQCNPEIKELEWKLESSDSLYSMIARTPFGNYKIRTHNWGCTLSMPKGTENLKTIEEAFNKAQECFNREVLRYIETNDNSKNH